MTLSIKHLTKYNKKVNSGHCIFVSLFSRQHPEVEMYRLAAILSLLPLGIFQVFAAEGTAEQIISRTEQVYRNLKTYQFSGEIAYESKNPDGQPRIFQQRFQCSRGEGGRLRYQSGLGLSKVLAVSDGTKGALYIADKRQYQINYSPDFEAFLRTSLDVESTAWIFPSIALLERYKHLREKFHNTALTENRDLELDGEKLLCFVIEGFMDSIEIDAVWGNRKTQLWIDKEQYIVRREVTTGTSTDNPAKGESLKEMITFIMAKTNTPIAEDLFTFDPPEGTKEVKQWFASEEPALDSGRTVFVGRPQFLQYELPFVAMRNFKLLSVDGQEISVSRYRGKLVLLDFWATWCVPCHKQMEDLGKILRKYRDNNVAVLGLNNETLGKTRAFLKTRTQEYPWLVDSGGVISSLYKVDILPSLVLLDRSGNVILKRENRQTFSQIELLLKEAGL